MPYTAPAPYPATAKHETIRLTPTKERHIFHLTGPAAAIGADRLLLSLISNVQNARLEMSDFFVVPTNGAPSTAEVKFKFYNPPGTQELGAYSIQTGTLLLQSGPPKFSIPVRQGMACDVLFDGDVLAPTDALMLSFVVERIYQAGF